MLFLKRFLSLYFHGIDIVRIPTATENIKKNTFFFTIFVLFSSLKIFYWLDVSLSIFIEQKSLTNCWFRAYFFFVYSKG